MIKTFRKRWFIATLLLSVTALTVSAQSGWQKQFIEKRAEIQALVKENNSDGFVSEVKKHKEAPSSISVDITGRKYLVLQATKGPSNSTNYDHGMWIDPVVIDKSGKKHKVNRMKPIYGKSGWGNVTNNANPNGAICKVDGKSFYNVVWMHGYGEAVYELPEGAVTFTADVAVEDGGNAKSDIEFKVVPNPIGVLIKNIGIDSPEAATAFRNIALDKYSSWFTELGKGVTNDIAETIINKLDDSSYFKGLYSSAGSVTVEDLNVITEANKVLDAQVVLSRVNLDGYIRTLTQIKKENPASTTWVNGAIKEAKAFKAEYSALNKAAYRNDKEALAKITAFVESQRVNLLKNPILKGKEILAIRQVINNARGAMAPNIGRNNNNWTTSAEVSKQGWDASIVKMSNLNTGVPSFETVLKGEDTKPLKDFDLSWDGDKLLYSTVGENNRWHIFEKDLSSGDVKRLSPDDESDIDFYDPVYLPDNRVILASNAAYVAVPCIGGASPASDLFLLDPKVPGAAGVRQLNFGQDCDWNPVVLNNGKVSYLRWEYTDNSHYFTRILMQMNPDGTAKKELYGSGSYFPNSLFDVRPIPDHPTEFVGIVSGHHGIARSGRLLIFDPSKGRKEVDGVVQEIPGYGKEVEPIIKDQLVNGVWPQFLTPYPLSRDYFLVSGKLTPNSLWGIYLVDKNDNMTLVYEKEGEAFVEPYIFAKRERSQIIPDRVNLKEDQATFIISDIYEGVGLKGVPKGTVKKLRVYAYQYGYNGVGGHNVMGIESCWDVKRLLGTVPVEADGSVHFKAPANTPIAVHPIDSEGRALQLMRSWMTGMPGETVSCVGCHEPQNMAPPAKPNIASRRAASTLTPWRGEVRPYTFANEMRPVLEKRCVGCHNGSKEGRPNFADTSEVGLRKFSKDYAALHPYVRRPGSESDFYTLEPMDYLANTSELVQILKKGHYGVELDVEDWDRLYTWIDLNVPFEGKYYPPEFRGNEQKSRRDQLSQKFGKVSLVGEDELAKATALREAKGKEEFIKPTAKREKYEDQSVKGWPFDAATAAAMQKKAAGKGAIKKSVTLDNGVTLDFVRIPAGKYVIGDNSGQPDQKESVVKIKKAFWMSTTEVTNQMYKTVFAEHDSRHIDMQWKDHIFPGYPADKDEMPVIRITWNQANEFCQLLSSKLDENVSLPTEEQWEWAARAGSDKAAYYGDIKSDFSAYENLADYTMRDLAVVGVDPKPMSPKSFRFPFYNFVPKVEEYNDGVLIPQGTAQYKPNAWGLYDMLGNVSEWTSSNYSYVGAGDVVSSDPLVTVKGGSWRDRPRYATAATRDGYYKYQKVASVGLRLVIND